MANSKRNADPINKPQRVFNIPPSVSFLDELAQSLVDGRLVPSFKIEHDWSVLADVTVYLPTRRAVRTLAEIFRSRAPNQVLFLPKIRSLGDIDLVNQVTDPKANTTELPPEMGFTERHLALTKLILGWMQTRVNQGELTEPFDNQISHASPSDAAWLSRELLSLMDQIEGEGANWAQLAQLVPDQYAEYWQMTIEFLKIAFDVWPKFLAEQGKMDPIARNAALIRREAKSLAKLGSTNPIIAAGSTGTVSATRELLKTIAELPNGAVILPGIDLTLDDASWDLITELDPKNNIKKYGDSNPGHPQFGLAKLIQHIGISRADIVSLCKPESTKLEIRNEVVSQAMKPIKTTDSWIKFRTNFTESNLSLALEDCSLIEAKNEIEEGLSIALVLREAVENGENAELICADPSLTRRVMSELERWSIKISDSTGQYLSHTTPTKLARLIVRLALHGLEPVTMLSLLKHQITSIGMSQSELKLAISAFERGILRGPQSDQGFEGLKRAITDAKTIQESRHHVPNWQKLSESEWDAIQHLIVKLEHALSPLVALTKQNEKISVKELARLTLHSLQLVGTDNNGNDHKLYSYKSTEDLIKYLTSLIHDNNSGLELYPKDWPAFFESLLLNITIIETHAANLSLGIYTPMESRLHRPDVTILAGLNEGSWPKLTRNDPWLNRPMKSEMGLDQPERRIGLSAHDFCQCLGTQRVIMTRSLRSGGSPTVASRWLQRLITVAGNSAATLMRKSGTKYLDWSFQLGHATAEPHPVSRPNPKPPITSRPTQLSITEIETWVRDPYAIYAQKILQFEPIEAIGGNPSVAEKGAIIHDCLAEFLLQCKGPFDETAITKLNEIGVKKFEILRGFPQVYALWWPRFQRIARWFVNNFESTRSELVQQNYLECSGKMEVLNGDRSFKLTGRADRIDLLKDGSLSVLDYKTGQVPSLPQVETLLAPQLPLEVAMIQSGGFQNIKRNNEISEQAYVVLSGGKTAGEVKNRNPQNVSIAELSTQAAQCLRDLVEAYYDPSQGYLSRARVFKEKIFSAPYDHLARVQEWSVGIVEEDE